MNFFQWNELGLQLSQIRAKTMNVDEVKSLVTILVTSGLSGATVHAYLSGQDIASTVSALATLAGVAYHVYQHWNMVKVPEKSVAK